MLRYYFVPLQSVPRNLFAENVKSGRKRIWNQLKRESKPRKINDVNSFKEILTSEIKLSFKYIITLSLNDLYNFAINLLSDAFI